MLKIALFRGFQMSPGTPPIRPRSVSSNISHLPAWSCIAPLTDLPTCCYWPSLLPPASHQLTYCYAVMMMQLPFASVYHATPAEVSGASLRPQELPLPQEGHCCCCCRCRCRSRSCSCSDSCSCSSYCALASAPPAKVS